jgi:hypothetical protein
MKDQKSLLAKCLHNDIPAIVFQGSDSCAIEILKAAENIYRQNGCSSEFLKDFHENVVENFKVYQQENKSEIKLPDLTPSEKEAFYIIQEKEFANFPPQIKDFEQHLKRHGFSQTHKETVSHGKYVVLNEKKWNGIIGKNGDYDFAINYNKETKQINYFLFSNDPNYPERIGDYNSLKTCFFDVLAKRPLQKEKKILTPMIEKYQHMSYENIANIIKKYSTNIETTFISGETTYTIENIEIQTCNAKTMIGNLTISQKENKPVAEINNYRIIDKSTGKTESLNVGNIDLGHQSPETLRKLLSGQQIEMPSKSNIISIMGLSKSPAGWALQIGKQTFNTADSSAEL